MKATFPIGVAVAAWRRLWGRLLAGSVNVAVASIGAAGTCRPGRHPSTLAYDRQLASGQHDVQPPHNTQPRPTDNSSFTESPDSHPHEYSRCTRSLPTILYHRAASAKPKPARSATARLNRYTDFHQPRFFAGDGFPRSRDSARTGDYRRLSRFGQDRLRRRNCRPLGIPRIIRPQGRSRLRSPRRPGR